MEIFLLTMNQENVFKKNMFKIKKDFKFPQKVSKRLIRFSFFANKTQLKLKKIIKMIAFKTIFYLNTINTNLLNSVFYFLNYCKDLSNYPSLAELFIMFQLNVLIKQIVFN
ncbi:hypothetical protein BpHYR1_029104 [Brachionus plicatilis]|uniref:Uncharacterized protein n=1 Tax=Brachionus plicatilis TaxID=10195 RepID=A0A3M7PCW5_BRAPC|nr:hypothetical protein BpHYR1_029104 [Brachionus plicatilis]